MLPVEVLRAPFGPAPGFTVTRTPVLISQRRAVLGSLRTETEARVPLNPHFKFPSHEACSLPAKTGPPQSFLSSVTLRTKGLLEEGHAFCAFPARRGKRPPKGALSCVISAAYPEDDTCSFSVPCQKTP